MLKMREMCNPYLRILKVLACHITDLIARVSNKHVLINIVCTGEKHFVIQF